MLLHGLLLSMNLPKRQHQDVKQQLCFTYWSRHHAACLLLVLCTLSQTCAALALPLVLVILQDYCRNVKARPAFMLLVPVLVFCVLCTLGIVGVKLGADQYEAETRARAQSVAMDWVSSTVFKLAGQTCWSVNLLAGQQCAPADVL
jgi:hypothetical protein